MQNTAVLTGPLICSLDVTYRCTLRCLHCFNNSGEQSYDQELTDLELQELGKQIVEISPNVICICGGEPLIRKDAVMRLCEQITSSSNTKVNMVTNGELLTKDVAKQIKNAGFFVVQVSIDGANAETHDWLRNKSGVFNRAVQAIKYLREEGLNVAISFVPNLKNVNQIDDAIDLCEKLGAFAFRVQPLMPMGRASKNLVEYTPKYQDYKELARKLDRLKYLNPGKGRIDVEWGDPVDHIIRFTSRPGWTTPSVGITATGKINISPYLPITFGDVRKHSLSTYWFNGLSSAWESPIVRYISRLKRSCDNLLEINSNTDIPKIYFEDGFDLDIMEEDIFAIAPEEIIYKNRRQ